MKAIIKKDDREICRAEVAESFFKRALGLMFRKKLEKNEALLIKFSERLKSKSLHGFFMRFPIDLIFLDDSFKVVEIANLKPWRIYNPENKACRYVLEVNEGFVEENNIKEGDVFEIEFMP